MQFTYYLLLIPAILISLTVHEYSHGYTAYKLGDPTAKSLGRLSLNPLRHIDPLGALSMIFFRVGWAKPVPINTRYFRKPRRDMALTAAAGPISNFLLSFICLFFYLLLASIYNSLLDTSVLSGFGLGCLYYLAYFFSICHMLNLSFGLFNLIPLTPLDGSRILYLFLPKKIYLWLVNHERQIYLFVLLWLVFGSRLAAILLRNSVVTSNPVLYYLVQFLSLTGWISTAANFISGLMLRFWTLIPFFA